MCFAGEDFDYCELSMWRRRQGANGGVFYLVAGAQLPLPVAKSELLFDLGVLRFGAKRYAGMLNAPHLAVFSMAFTVIQNLLEVGSMSEAPVNHQDSSFVHLHVHTRSTRFCKGAIREERGINRFFF